MSTKTEPNRSNFTLGFVVLVADFGFGGWIAEQVRPSRRARMSTPGSTPPSTGGSPWGTCAYAHPYA